MMFRKEHIEKIVRGHKTQTRRLSRLRTRLYEVGRAYRIRRDWYHFTDIWILVTKRYRQRLGDITPEEINKEGYETLEEFQRAWIEINGAWDRDKVVWVYEFKVLNSSEDRMERR